MKYFSKTGQMTSSSWNKGPWWERNCPNLTHPHTGCLGKLCLDIPRCSMEAEIHGKDAGAPWRMTTRSKFQTGFAAHVGTQWGHEVFILSQVRNRKLSGEKKKFFSNLLQKLTTKALYSAVKLFSKGTWTKYICLQSPWEASQASSCVSVRPEKAPHLGTGARSLCFAFSFP